MLLLVSLCVWACAPEVLPERVAHPETWRAPAAGPLPERGGLIGGVEVPPGGIVEPPESSNIPAGEQVLWVSTAPVEDPVQIMVDLIAAFPETGLWPVLIEVRPFAGDRDTLDHPNALAPLFGMFFLSQPGDVTTAEEYLAEAWANAIPSSDDGRPLSIESEYASSPERGREAETLWSMVAPFGAEFPGLAPPGPGEIQAAECMRELEGFGPQHLGLIPATRPGEILEVAGFAGGANYGIPGGAYTAVLDSWEARFRAAPVFIGSGTLGVIVCRPPSGDAAEVLAAEMFAFDPDIVWQGVGSIQALAEDIDASSVWLFWWD